MVRNRPQSHRPGPYFTVRTNWGDRSGLRGTNVSNGPFRHASCCRRYRPFAADGDQFPQPLGASLVASFSEPAPRRAARRGQGSTIPSELLVVVRNFDGFYWRDRRTKDQKAAFFGSMVRSRPARLGSSAARISRARYSQVRSPHNPPCRLPSTGCRATTTNKLLSPKAKGL